MRRHGISLISLLILCVLFFPEIPVYSLSFASEKGISVNITHILRKQIFFSFSDVKKVREPSLPVFISQIQPPQPLDRIYSLMGTFFYNEDPGKSIAVLSEINSKKVIFLKKNDIINGNRVLSIDESGVVFESVLGENFLLTQSGIKYSQTLPQRFYFNVNTKTAIDWLKLQPEFLNAIKFVPANGIGFSVQEIEPGSVFEAAGLGKDDRIIQINDIMLKTHADAISAYHEIFKTGRKVAIVKLVRNNKPVELIYILE
ncbi:MAG: hypothetical protein N2115_02520 [bacterium]|nr:hypothetical protein [bacterium]